MTGCGGGSHSIVAWRYTLLASKSVLWEIWFWLGDYIILVGKLHCMGDGMQGWSMGWAGHSLPIVVHVTPSIGTGDAMMY